MKKIISSSLISVVTVIFTISCAATGQNINSYSGQKQSQYVELNKNETEEARQFLKAAKNVEEIAAQKQPYIDEGLLPLPDLSISDAFFYGQDNQVDSTYYSEFKEFNVPMAMTSRVSFYIKYFTERVPDITQNWLNRANKYMYLVQDIFVKEGIPTDLVALGLTESGFNPHAISRAGAVGLWQFIPSTGKLYGMENNFWVDERRDFEKSTYAAAKYLNDLHNSFNDWYLALAAYNAGPGKIARATKKHATRDYFIISQNRYTLKLETRDYVPKFLALLIIYKNYLKYGFTAPTEKPLVYDKVVLPGQTNLFWLAKNLDIETDVLFELNPSLKLPITPPVSNYKLRVPYGKGELAGSIVTNSEPIERAQYKIYNAKPGEKIANIAAKYNVAVDSVKDLNAISYASIYASRPIFIPMDNMRNLECDNRLNKQLSKLSSNFYKVKKGDTFIEIAHKHGMRVRDLQRLNPGVSSNRLRIGQVVSVGGALKSVKKISYATNIQKLNIKNAWQVAKYTVQDGDTLWSIAKRFGTTVDTIKNANNLRNESIQPGKVLAIKR